MQACGMISPKNQEIEFVELHSDFWLFTTNWGHEEFLRVFTQFTPQVDAFLEIRDPPPLTPPAPQSQQVVVRSKPQRVSDPLSTRTFKVTFGDAEPVEYDLDQEKVLELGAERLFELGLLRKVKKDNKE